MATTTRAQGAPEKKPSQEETSVEIKGPSRREFLYYIWGASMIMLMGQAAAGIIWFALPRFKEGEFGGEFRFAAEDVPQAGASPLEVPEGRMHLVNTGDGFLALYAVCTHLGCLPKWSEVNRRFECPCHGSRFELNGDYIEGPAPRGLDRFAVTLTFADGTQASTNNRGDPLPLDGREVVEIIVDTGSRIHGPGK